MTMTAINFFSFGAVSDAFGAWCRNFEIKELMAVFGCAEGTAKNWRGGKLPEPRHLVAMAERWGWEFIEAVFSPAANSLSDQSLLGELEAVEARIHGLRERIKHEQSFSAAARSRLAGGGGLAGAAGRGVPGAGADGEYHGGGLQMPRWTRARRVVVPTLAGLMMLSAAFAPVVDDIAIAVADLLCIPHAVMEADDDDMMRSRHGQSGGKPLRLARSRRVA